MRRGGDLGEGEGKCVGRKGGLRGTRELREREREKGKVLDRREGELEDYG